METIEWIKLEISKRDEDFIKFQEYVLNLACAVYAVPPSILYKLPVKWWYKFVFVKLNITIEKFMLV